MKDGNIQENMKIKDEENKQAPENGEKEGDVC